MIKNMIDYFLNILFLFLLIKSSFDGATYSGIKFLFDLIAFIISFLILSFSLNYSFFCLIIFCFFHYKGSQYAFEYKKSGLYEFIFGALIGLLHISSYIIINTTIYLFNDNCLNAEFFDNFFVRIFMPFSEYLYTVLK